MHNRHQSKLSPHSCLSTALTMDAVLLERVNELITGTKTQRALNGGLLPLNNNASVLEVAEISTVTVVDTDGETPVAFGAFNRYSANQAYCMLNEIVDKYRKNYVKVEKVEKEGADKRNMMLKIADVVEERTSLGGLPQYFNAFAERMARPLLQHVVDALLENTVGTGNMDVKKNITVDLYDGMNPEYNTFDDALWRDFSGFVVTDRYRYFEIDIPKNSLIDVVSKQEKSGATLRFDDLNKKSEPFFGDYDSCVAIAHRQDFLDFFTRLHGVKGTIAFDEGNEPAGYVLSLHDRILQCYAETAQISNELLAKHVSSMEADTVKMFIRHDDEWIGKDLLASATSTRRVRRFHTRTMPAQVKWSKVFVVNTGLNLF
ncbi:hypothetical protein QR680_002250 [Steinernema hermaphroditum]|uniref:DUF7596 domain-containing protein n=1 Tax=Steinernema hermaphroditum TaxID=289476 RepID=A0AA39H1Z8_9BILA|nr:hypothetical protein QR680_002250 [Steinernema hermaphroditum]